MCVCVCEQLVLCELGGNYEDPGSDATLDINSLENLVEQKSFYSLLIKNTIFETIFEIIFQDNIFWQTEERDKTLFPQKLNQISCNSIRCCVLYNRFEEAEKINISIYT